MSNRLNFFEEVIHQASRGLLQCLAFNLVGCSRGKPYKIFLLYSLSPLVKFIEKEIQCQAIGWIPLDVGHLNSFKKSFKRTLKYGF